MPEVQPAAPRLIVVRLPASSGDAAEFEHRFGSSKAKQLLSSAGVRATLSLRRGEWDGKLFIVHLSFVIVEAMPFHNDK
jgi:hypothetical protein